MKRLFKLTSFECICGSVAALALASIIITAGCNGGGGTESVDSPPPMARFTIHKKTEPPGYPDLFLVTDAVTGEQYLYLYGPGNCAATVRLEKPKPEQGR